MYYIIKKLSGLPDDCAASVFHPDEGLPWSSGPEQATTVLFAPDLVRASGVPRIAPTSPVATAVTSGAASPLVINVTWDASVQSAPSGFTAGVLAAVQYLESQFSDAITLNINIGYGEVNGSALGAGALGSSQSFLTTIGYASLLSALKQDVKTTADATAVASLPATSPVSGTYWATTGEAKALGLLPGNQATTDGYAGFSSSQAFDYNNADGVTAGSFDFNGVVLHELSEVMGRMLLTGASIGTATSGYDTYDLFHYSLPGVRDFSASTPGYLSTDSGVSNFGGFNTVAGGDAGDWGNGMGSDSFNAFSSSGVVNAVSSADLTALDVIGWDRTTVAALPPNGVAIAPATGSLAGAQGTGGLAAKAALATLTQIGGRSTDSYGFTLGGSGAAAFALSTTSSVGTLSTGASGVAGSVNGRVYSLALSANDLNSGLSSTPVPLSVVVGSSGADTVSVASLVGSTAVSTPSFIFGLAGGDQLDASGMTSRLWIVGGAGADILTGGSGVNDYLYGASSDSAAATPDIITNFHTTDLIDLTGLGVALQYAGKLGGTTLNAASVGWQIAQGNTFIYVNTSAAVENLSATNMKIELRGSVSLTAGNISHA